jgi:hypothetical protein
MDDRRLVGIDLSITSAHTVRVLRADGTTVCRRKAVPTIQSLGEVERAALAGVDPSTTLEVVVEPTGPAWLPIAVFFTQRGHTVYRVSSAKAHDLRRVLSRHAKSNSIDADTLARLPLVDPTGLQLLELPARSGPPWTGVCAPPTGSPAWAPNTSVASRTWSASCCPAAPGRVGTGLGRPTGRAGRRGGPAHQGHRAGLQPPPGRRTGRPVAWSAQAALELYGDHPAVAFQDLAAEVQPRCGCCAPTRPSWPPTPPNASTATAGSTRFTWPAACPASPTSVPRPGRHHGPPGPLPARRQLLVLHRAGPSRVRDRRGRPQGPAHLQSRQPAAAHHLDPRR